MTSQVFDLHTYILINCGNRIRIINSVISIFQSFIHLIHSFIHQDISFIPVTSFEQPENSTSPIFSSKTNFSANGISFSGRK